MTIIEEGVWGGERERERGREKEREKERESGRGIRKERAELRKYQKCISHGKGKKCFIKHFHFPYIPT